MFSLFLMVILVVRFKSEAEKLGGLELEIQSR